MKTTDERERKLNKDRKEQMGDTSHSESVRAK